MESRELPFVREMFDNIAPRYDLLNRLLSLRQDVVWRKKLVSAMVIPENGKVLDVACGTGDLSLEICRQKGPLVKVVGIDFSPGMLCLAQEKIRRNQNTTISLLTGDALALPFGNASFHAVTIAFGIRNIQDKASALRAFCDCLIPGGMVLVLELATPKKSRLRDAYLAYFQKVLPTIGRLFSRHSFAYSYLPESVSRFPETDAFMTIMEKAGFSHVTCRRLTLGIANLFMGIKPR
ncbi:bifunctional demethylmenaquinone methyltransferase/2-methoxy-6-polyprenyl-1,4-benzoquinol methylase UbiE [uncultured Desulfosarcina sp.]|uniref:bifunctional demethylmenaquinone methyltransferase/2-methoxy-6-polyprenyl-1,4-benzoquinol methylase UbiE n=1 Tax=uncultured Desulfosarcina sp. TaxID=218289 RepID=UPI0029C8AF04|nr:bifunctional demethylmenaquinone methyltransferase/2-methoxy-6-polyprenyl-1,4-benzoquinol methylase UbiE [uncultured Desulfosarcina sp.]